MRGKERGGKEGNTGRVTSKDTKDTKLGEGLAAKERHELHEFSRTTDELRAQSRN